jgi:hypothetical protein
MKIFIQEVIIPSHSQNLKQLFHFKIGQDRGGGGQLFYSKIGQDRGEGGNYFITK